MVGFIHEGARDWQGNLGYVVAVGGGGVPGDGGTNEGVWVRHEVRDERKPSVRTVAENTGMNMRSHGLLDCLPATSDAPHPPLVVCQASGDVHVRT